MPDYAYEDVNIANRAREWAGAVARRLAVLKIRDDITDDLAAEVDYLKHLKTSKELRGALRVVDDYVEHLRKLEGELEELEYIISTTVDP
jgi:hypothetical protein